MAETENLPTVTNGNYHLAKRDLLRLGVERGYLRMSEIRAALPPPHIALPELELFLFSAHALGIDLDPDVEIFMRARSKR